MNKIIGDKEKEVAAVFRIKLLCSSRIREDVGVVLCFSFIVFHDEFKTSSRSQLLGGAHSLNFVVNNFVFVYKNSSSTVQLLLACQNWFLCQAEEVGCQTWQRRPLCEKLRSPLGLFHSKSLVLQTIAAV